MLSRTSTASRLFLLLTPLQMGGGWGCTRSLEGTADPSWPKGHSTAYGIMLSIWSGGRRKKGWKFGIKAFMFPSDCHVWWSPAFLGWLNTCLSLGSGELISWFALPVYGAFALPNYLPLSQPTRFFGLLLFQFSSPSHQEGVSQQL